MDTSSYVICDDTSSGRVAVMASPLMPIPMVRIAGVWYKAVLGASDLKHNFRPVIPPTRRERILKEAQKVVAQYPGIVDGPWLHEIEGVEE